METYLKKLSREGASANRQNTIWSEEIAAKCNHEWKPVTLRMESSGEAPDLNYGRVYCVCMRCYSHTYIDTGWVGSYIGSPDTLEADFKLHHKADD